MLCGTRMVVMAVKANPMRKPGKMPRAKRTKLCMIPMIISGVTVAKNVKATASA